MITFKSLTSKILAHPAWAGIGVLVAVVALVVSTYQNSSVDSSSVKSDRENPVTKENASTTFVSQPPLPLSDVNVAQAFTDILTRSGCTDGAVQFSGLVKNHTKAAENSHGMDASFVQVALKTPELPRTIVQATGRGKGAAEAAVAKLAQNIAIVIKEKNLCE